MRTFLREPLVHFLALGTIVFALFGFRAERDAPPDGRIVVSAGKIEQLRTVFSRVWNRPPSEQEHDALVEDHIREEILYREALAMGLDKDDTIVRRRLRQKLEFLTEAASVAPRPTDKDLQRWLDRHPENFLVAPAIAFSQVYFNPGRSGASALAATQALARLKDAAIDTAVADLGDPTTLPRELPLTAMGEVAKLFGPDFAQQLAQLAPGQWTGPIQSGYGWHLVHVSERSSGGARPLAEVRGAVEREWLEVHQERTVEATYQKLREKYVVVIETRIEPAGPQGQGAPAGARIADGPKPR